MSHRLVEHIPSGTNTERNECRTRDEQDCRNEWRMNKEWNEYRGE